ncbi:MAG: hypothetical protein ACLPX5_00510 [Dissulfurispiraceae bacterium]
MQKCYLNYGGTTLLAPSRHTYWLPRNEFSLDDQQPGFAGIFFGISLFLSMLVATMVLVRSWSWLGEKQVRKLEAVTTAPTVLGT